MGDRTPDRGLGRDLLEGFTASDTGGGALPTTPLLDGEKLSSSVGPPHPADGSAAAAGGDLSDLRVLVGDRAPAVDRASVNADAPQMVRRTRGRRDRVTAVVTAVAAVSVVGAIVAGVIAVTSTSPAADALTSLRETEAALVDGTASLNTRIERAVGQVDDALVQATALGGALAATAGVADEPARSAAEVARQDFLVTVGKIRFPQSLTPYHRPLLDETSLAEVGNAIDAAQQKRMDLQVPEAALSKASAAFAGAEAKLQTALSAFAITLPGAAAAVREQNPLSAPTLTDALAAAAGRASGSDFMTADGQRALSDLVSAADAVRADQQRAEAESVDTSESGSRNTYEGGSGQTDSADSGEMTDPGTTPPTEAPVEPTPVEPTPVEPAPEATAEAPVQ